MALGGILIATVAAALVVGWFRVGARGRELSADEIMLLGDVGTLRDARPNMFGGGEGQTNGRASRDAVTGNVALHSEEGL